MSAQGGNRVVPAAALVDPATAAAAAAAAPPRNRIECSHPHWNLPTFVLDNLSKVGIVKFLKTQVPALQAGIYGGQVRRQRTNLLIHAPTSSGKTLIGDVLLIQALLQAHQPGQVSGRLPAAVILVPSHALVRQRVEALNQLLQTAEPVEPRLIWRAAPLGPAALRTGARVLVSTYERAALSFANMIADSADLDLRGTPLQSPAHGSWDAGLSEPDLSAAPPSMPCAGGADDGQELPPLRLEDVAFVLADEVHLVADEHRGARVEGLLTMLLWASRHAALLEPGTPGMPTALPAALAQPGQTLAQRGLCPLQIVGMSATLTQPHVLANWLRAKLLRSNRRPVELHEQYACGNMIYSLATDEPVAELAMPQMPAAVSALAEPLGAEDWTLLMSVLWDKLQDPDARILIFCNSRDATSNTALKVMRMMAALPSMQPDAEAREAMSQHMQACRAVKALDSGSHDVVSLSDCLDRGVAWFHAGIPADAAAAVLWCARNAHVRVIASTTSLEAGVNLPVTCVVIQNPQFRAGQFIPATMYRQMAGRAGRLGWSTKGCVVAVCTGAAMVAKLKQVAQTHDQVMPSWLLPAPQATKDVQLDAVSSALEELRARQAELCELASAMKSIGVAASAMSATMDAMKDTVADLQLKICRVSDSAEVVHIARLIVDCMSSGLARCMPKIQRVCAHSWWAARQCDVPAHPNPSQPTPPTERATEHAHRWADTVVSFLVECGFAERPEKGSQSLEVAPAGRAAAKAGLDPVEALLLQFTLRKVCNSFLLGVPLASFMLCTPVHGLPPVNWEWLGAEVAKSSERALAARALGYSPELVSHVLESNVDSLKLEKRLSSLPKGTTRTSIVQHQRIFAALLLERLLDGVPVALVAKSTAWKTQHWDPFVHAWYQKSVERLRVRALAFMQTVEGFCDARAQLPGSAGYAHVAAIVHELHKRGRDRALAKLHRLLEVPHMTVHYANALYRERLRHPAAVASTNIAELCRVLQAHQPYLAPMEPLAMPDSEPGGQQPCLGSQLTSLSSTSRAFVTHVGAVRDAVLIQRACAAYCKSAAASAGARAVKHGILGAIKSGEAFDPLQELHDAATAKLHAVSSSDSGSSDEEPELHSISSAETVDAVAGYVLRGRGRNRGDRLASVAREDSAASQASTASVVSLDRADELMAVELQNASAPPSARRRTSARAASRADLITPMLSKQDQRALASVLYGKCRRSITAKLVSNSSRRTGQQASDSGARHGLPAERTVAVQDVASPSVASPRASAGLAGPRHSTTARALSFPDAAQTSPAATADTLSPVPGRYTGSAPASAHEPVALALPAAQVRRPSTPPRVSFRALTPASKLSSMLLSQRRGISHTATQPFSTQLAAAPGPADTSALLLPGTPQLAPRRIAFASPQPHVSACRPSAGTTADGMMDTLLQALGVQPRHRPEGSMKLAGDVLDSWLQGGEAVARSQAPGIQAAQDLDGLLPNLLAQPALAVCPVRVQLPAFASEPRWGPTLSSAQGIRQAEHAGAALLASIQAELQPAQPNDSVASLLDDGAAVCVGCSFSWGLAPRERCTVVLPPALPVPMYSHGMATGATAKLPTPVLARIFLFAGARCKPAAPASHASPAFTAALPLVCHAWHRAWALAQRVWHAVHVAPRWRALQRVFSDPSKRFVAYDSFTVVTWLKQAGLALRGHWLDPITAHWMLDPDDGHRPTLSALVAQHVTPVQALCAWGADDEQAWDELPGTLRDTLSSAMRWPAQQHSRIQAVVLASTGKLEQHGYAAFVCNGVRGLAATTGRGKHRVAPGNALATVIDQTPRAPLAVDPNHILRMRLLRCLQPAEQYPAAAYREQLRGMPSESGPASAAQLAACSAGPNLSPEYADHVVGVPSAGGCIVPCAWADAALCDPALLQRVPLPGQPGMLPVWHCAMSRAVLTWAVMDVLWQALYVAQQQHAFERVEMPAVQPLSSICRAGFGVDMARLNSAIEATHSALLSMSKAIIDMVGQPVNMADPHAIATTIYDKLGLVLPPAAARAARQEASRRAMAASRDPLPATAVVRSTTRAALQALADTGELFPRLVLRWRPLALGNAVLRGLRGLACADALHSAPGAAQYRLHPQLNALTATGRVATTHPQLQTLAKDMEYLPAAQYSVWLEMTQESYTPAPPPRKPLERWSRSMRHTRAVKVFIGLATPPFQSAPVPQFLRGFLCEVLDECVHCAWEGQGMIAPQSPADGASPPSTAPRTLADAWAHAGWIYTPEQQSSIRVASVLLFDDQQASWHSVQGLLPAVRVPADMVFRTCATRYYGPSVTSTRVKASELYGPGVQVWAHPRRCLPRTMLLASPGHVLVSADYSQIELRILAELSGDAQLQRAFSQPDSSDVFTTLAQQWAAAGVCAPRPSSQEAAVPGEKRARGTAQPLARSDVKAVVYALLYGKGDAALAADLRCDMDRAKQLRASFFQRHPGVAAWRGRTLAEVRSTGRVCTLMGRVRLLEDINHHERAARAAAERQAINTACQGSAADVLKVALAQVYEKLAMLADALQTSVLLSQDGSSAAPGAWLVANGLAVQDERRWPAKIVLQVHDEIVVECEQSMVPQVRSLLERCMTDIPIPVLDGADGVSGPSTRAFSVPLCVQVHVGKTWQEVSVK